MRVVLLGAPGSGKGTQAKLMAEKYKIPQISTGELLRAAVAEESTLGTQAKAAMDVGQLVSDDLVLAMIQERLTQEDTKNGFILDGFPRNMAQTEVLEAMLIKLGMPVQLGLLIDIDFDALMQRLTGRRTCRSCGRICNIFSSPPHLDGQCDHCGGNLRHRADDNEETISNRLRVYESQTCPVIEYYREQDKLRTVQGLGDVRDIFKAVCKVANSIKEDEGFVTVEDLEKKVMETALKARRAEEDIEPVSKKKDAKKESTAKKKTAASKKAASLKKPLSNKKKVTGKAPSSKILPSNKKKVTRKAPSSKKSPSNKKKVANKIAAKKKAINKKKTIAKKKVVKKKAVTKKKGVKKKKSR